MLNLMPFFDGFFPDAINNRLENVLLYFFSQNIIISFKGTNGMEKKTAYKRFRGDVRKDLFRIPVTITPEIDEWLESLRSRMKKSGGYKLPKSYILRAILDSMMDLKIDVMGIKTEKDLKVRVSEAVAIYKKRI